MRSFPESTGLLRQKRPVVFHIGDIFPPPGVGGSMGMQGIGQEEIDRIDGRIGKGFLMIHTSEGSRTSGSRTRTVRGCKRRSPSGRTSGSVSRSGPLFSFFSRTLMNLRKHKRHFPDGIIPLVFQEFHMRVHESAEPTGPLKTECPHRQGCGMITGTLQERASAFLEQCQEKHGFVIAIPCETHFRRVG